MFLHRGDYWQVGAAIPKGRLPAMQAAGIHAFRAAMAAAAPDFADRLEQITSWDDVKLLEVRADRLRRWWRPGLLYIGDAAHAMSPVGGIGINFAVQDAVVAANHLVGPLRRGWVSDADLRSVQRARQLPTAIVQSFQSVAQRGLSLLLARSSRPVRPPAIIRLVPPHIPVLRTLPARFLAFGLCWPVHVTTPDAGSRADDPADARAPLVT